MDFEKAAFILLTAQGCLKIVQTTWKHYVLWTPWKWDDELIEKLSQSKSYPVLVFIVDLLLRLKLPIKR